MTAGPTMRTPRIHERSHCQASRDSRPSSPPTASPLRRPRGPEGAGEGEVVGGGEFEVAAVAGHEAHGVAERGHERRVVGGVVGPPRRRRVRAGAAEALRRLDGVHARAVEGLAVVSPSARRRVSATGHGRHGGAVLARTASITSLSRRSVRNGRTASWTSTRRASPGSAERAACTLARRVAPPTTRCTRRPAPRNSASASSRASRRQASTTSPTLGCAASARTVCTSTGASPRSEVLLGRALAHAGALPCRRNHHRHVGSF